MGKGIAGSPRSRAVSERWARRSNPRKYARGRPRGPHRPVSAVVGPPRPAQYRSQNPYCLRHASQLRMSRVILC